MYYIIKAAAVLKSSDTAHVAALNKPSPRLCAQPVVSCRHDDGILGLSHSREDLFGKRRQHNKHAAVHRCSLRVQTMGK